MKTLLNDMGIVQNMGWHDRTIRVVVGSLMISVPLYLLMSASAPVASWMFYVILVAVYPVLTGIIGFDVFYNLFRVRSCGSSNRNQCGSYPYEIDAALGHNPIPDSDNVHDLEHSHHAT